MGAQIAAHLVNCKVPVILFDLPAKEGPKNGIVTKAIEGLKKLKPAPLGVPEDAALIQAANYEEHMELLTGCDLIIEAIAERMDWKTDLYHKIAPFIAEGAIVASNTSGLSITKLSEALPEAIKPRFCGIHFFNPPRYMYLVELINTPTTQPQILDDLESFVTSGLGKGVVRAHDTPNFIANRVGIAGMLATMKQVENFGLSLRRGGRLDRQKTGSRQFGHLPHCRRGGFGHHDARDQNAARQFDIWKVIRFTATLRRPPCWPSCSNWAISVKKPALVFTKKQVVTFCVLTPMSKITCPAAKKPMKWSGACSKNQQPNA